MLGNCHPGHYGAYNWALEVYAQQRNWDAWFHGADDLNFHPGWLTNCRSLLEPSVVVGTNDLLSKRVARGVAATHYLVDRRFTIEHPLAGVNPPAAYFDGYHHMFGETEFVDHAQSLGRFRPCVEAVVEHMHPLAGKAEHDATYSWGESRAEHDRELYLERRAA